MFCFQCQETAKGTGCTIRGVCGKEESTANLQDLIIFHCKGIAVLTKLLNQSGIDKIEDAGRIITSALFTTITNANFDNEALIACVNETQSFKADLKASLGGALPDNLHDAATYISDDASQFQDKAKTVGILSTEDEDVRSLREMVVFGSKGISAYAHHAAMLGVEKKEIYAQLIEGLASETRLEVSDITALITNRGANYIKTPVVLALFYQDIDRVMRVQFVEDREEIERLVTFFVGTITLERLS